MIDIKGGHKAGDHSADPKQASSGNEHSRLGPELPYLGDEDPVLDLEKVLSEVLWNTKYPVLDSEEALPDTDDSELPGFPESPGFLMVLHSVKEPLEHLALIHEILRIC